MWPTCNKKSLWFFISQHNKRLFQMEKNFCLANVHFNSPSNYVDFDCDIWPSCTINEHKKNLSKIQKAKLATSQAWLRKEIWNEIFRTSFPIPCHIPFHIIDPMKYIFLELPNISMRFNSFDNCFWRFLQISFCLIVSNWSLCLSFCHLICFSLSS